MVDRARKYLVAWRLVHRNTFSGDGGLVNRTVAFADDAVQRHTFARLDADGRANGDVGRRRDYPGAIGREHQRFFRCQLQQAGDGVARPIHRLCFDEFGDCIQRHHHGSLRPLTDQECTRHGDRHQGADGQSPTEDRLEALGVGFPTREVNGDGRYGHADRGPFPGVWREVGDRLRRNRDDQRRDQSEITAVTLRQLIRVPIGVGLFREWLRLKAGLANGIKRFFQCVVRCIDAYRPARQLEVQALNAGDRFNHAPYLGFFDAAVHAGYVKRVRRHRFARHF